MTGGGGERNFVTRHPPTKNSFLFGYTGKVLKQKKTTVSWHGRARKAALAASDGRPDGRGPGGLFFFFRATREQRYVFLGEDAWAILYTAPHCKATALRTLFCDLLYSRKVRTCPHHKNEGNTKHEKEKKKKQAHLLFLFFFFVNQARAL